MFKENDNCYVKTSTGYLPCKIIRKQGSYYIVQSESSAFGASEHRLITIAEYDKQFPICDKQTFYRPPELH